VGVEYPLAFERRWIGVDNAGVDAFHTVVGDEGRAVVEPEDNSAVLTEIG
jgi:hypothetical protein